MIEIIFAFLLLGVAGFIAFVATAYILSFFPDRIQDMIELGCGSLVALAEILPPIGAFCD